MQLFPMLILLIRFIVQWVKCNGVKSPDVPICKPATTSNSKILAM